MSIQDRNKDTAGPQARRYSRRAFINTAARFATGVAAAPLLLAAEPVIGGLGFGKPVEAAAERGTEKAQDAIPPLIFVTHRNPDDPEGTAKWLEQRDKVNSYFRQVLAKAEDSGIPELQQDKREFLDMNGKPPQPTLGQFTEKQYLDIIMPSDPNQVSKVSFIVVANRIERDVQYDNIFLIIANNLGGDNNPSNIQPLLEFHQVMEIGRLMKSTARTFSGSGEELVAKLNAEKPERDMAAEKSTLAIYKRAKESGIIGSVFQDSPYYSLKLQADLPEPEEAADPPPEVPSDEAAVKPAASADAAEADDSVKPNEPAP